MSKVASFCAVNFHYFAKIGKKLGEICVFVCARVVFPQKLATFVKSKNCKVKKSLGQRDTQKLSFLRLSRSSYTIVI
jgi:hypothetical protein